ncbi:mitochondrial carrier protein [Raphidocelis subcapitata]|uniref:Mitochondrial carrier protein n=1 Tax=Raphidocelis subcapitata TaxID=307507 RepID=A0A2V0P604_9CHLO|nr:mitochondrial carrier protein [Raphidocelis subcapitata]|eukprot:GBF95304.1 mitochondrial carrier protein [Raphidocelis subcapitata]
MSDGRKEPSDLLSRGHTAASVLESPAAAFGAAAAARLSPPPASPNPGPRPRAAAAAPPPPAQQQGMAAADVGRQAGAVHVPDSEPSTSYDGLTFVSHMIAGSVAGIIEHTAMYPVDTIKTRMQALSHPGQRLHSSTLQALRAVLRREGVGGLYRGVTAVAGGAGPAHALYFASYEAAKRALGGDAEGHHPLAAAAAGAAATLVNDAAMTPVDVVKQRLQVAHSPYSGPLDCVRQVVRQEGTGALFRSYRTTIVMNIPYTAVHFSVYESAKKLLLGDDAAAEEGLREQVIAGGLAGGTASALTTPLDVVKTRLQTEGVHSPRRYGTTAVLPVLRRIVREEGAGALWRGIGPRVLFHAPAAAVCWGSYETMKTLLAGEHQ